LGLIKVYYKTLAVVATMRSEPLVRSPQLAILMRYMYCGLFFIYFEM